MSNIYQHTGVIFVSVAGDMNQWQATGPGSQPRPVQEVDKKKTQKTVMAAILCLYKSVRNANQRTGILLYSFLAE
jgi:hypothetical protein